jgi:hypothetical protein
VARSRMAGRIRRTSAACSSGPDPAGRPARPGLGQRPPPPHPWHAEVHRQEPRLADLLPAARRRTRPQPPGSIRSLVSASSATLQPPTPPRSPEPSNACPSRSSTAPTWSTASAQPHGPGVTHSNSVLNPGVSCLDARTPGRVAQRSPGRPALCSSTRQSSNWASGGGDLAVPPEVQCGAVDRDDADV